MSMLLAQSAVQVMPWLALPQFVNLLSCIAASCKACIHRKALLTSLQPSLELWGRYTQILQPQPEQAARVMECHLVSYTSASADQGCSGAECF